MATTVTPGVKQISVSVDNPGRDDFGGLRIWMSTVNGFTPGPTNLVYDGLDLEKTFGNLTAGTPYYFRLALYSQIDPTSVLTSAQYTATPTAPTVLADDILAGTIRGSNLFAGSIGTKGSTLTARVNGSEELLGDGPEVDFSFNVGAWINGTGWTIGSGRANASALSNGNKMGRFGFQMVVGQNYTVTLDIPTRISGSLSVFQASGNTAIPNTNAVGVGRTVSFVATQTAFEIVSVGFEGSFDNISLKFTVPATVVPVQNAVDFPASGTAVVFSPDMDSDYNVFTYTGKTATTLTGVTGLRTQRDKSVVVPHVESMVIDQSVNQMRFIGDRGDGTIELLAAIGLFSSPFNGLNIASFGSSNFSSGIPLEAKSGGLFAAASFINSSSIATITPALFANGVYGYGVQGTGAHRGVYGYTPGTELDSVGGWFQAENATRSAALKLRAGGNNAGSAVHAVHISFDNLYDLDPSSAQKQGDIYMRSDGRMVGATNLAGTAWKAYVRDADTIWAANGLASDPGVSFFNDPDSGMYRRGADVLGWSTGGVEMMYLGANLNVVNSVFAGLGSAATPSFSFITDPDSGMYRKAVNQVGFSAGGVEVFYYDSSKNVNFANNIGVGDADPTASATINAKSVVSGTSARQGLNNLLEIDNTAALGAVRSYYAAFNDVSVGLTVANRAGFNNTAYGSFNRAKAGITAGTPGSTGTLYGSYNVAINQVSQVADTFNDLFGAWNEAENAGAASGGDVWGTVSKAKATTAEVISTLHGVYSNIVNELATVSNAYLYRGILTHTSGTITHKWGLHLTGTDKHHLDGYVELDGIKFPATHVSSSDVNMLDDYEEGTFTPVVEGNTTPGVGTYTVQVGRYTKIGNRVFGTINLGWSAHTGTGPILIKGLPFTTRNITNADTPMTVIANGLTYTGTLVAYVFENASQFLLREQTSGAAFSNVGMDTVVAALKISFQYETAT